MSISLLQHGAWQSSRCGLIFLNMLAMLCLTQLLAALVTRAWCCLTFAHQDLKVIFGKAALQLVKIPRCRTLQCSMVNLMKLPSAHFSNLQMFLCRVAQPSGLSITPSFVSPADLLRVHFFHPLMKMLNYIGYWPLRYTISNRPKGGLCDDHRPLRQPVQPGSGPHHSLLSPYFITFTVGMFADISYISHPS